MKKHREFKKTPFGRRATTFSWLPAVFAIPFLVGLINNIENENHIIPILFFIGFSIAVIGACITQLQYAIFLKDFIDADEKK